MASVILLRAETELHLSILACRNVLLGSNHSTAANVNMCWEQRASGQGSKGLHIWH